MGNLDESVDRRWQERLLAELGEGDLVFCYPGLMGSVCEQLVERGLASREAVGKQPKPVWWPEGTKANKDWQGRAGDQFRYSITDLGRAALEEPK